MDHVVLRDHLPAHGHRSRHLDERPEPERVDRKHAVDLLPRLGLPHLRGERRAGREVGRHREVAPLLARVRPSPALGEVVVRERHCARRQLQVAGVGHRPELELAVLDGHHARAQEHPRPGPHLGVVGREHEVLGRSLRHRRDALRRFVDIDHRLADLSELVRELAPGIAQRSEQRLARPEIHILQFARAFAATRPSSRTSATRSGPAVVGRSSFFVDSSIASVPTRTTCAAELVSALTERIWRPITGRMTNGFNRNESPALGRLIELLLAPHASARDPDPGSAGPARGRPAPRKGGRDPAARAAAPGRAATPPPRTRRRPRARPRAR